MAFGPESVEFSVIQGLNHFHQQISTLGNSYEQLLKDLPL